MYLEHKNVILDHVQLKKVILEHSITGMFITTPLFHQLAQADLTLFQSLQTLIIGGDVLNVTHTNQVLRTSPDLLLVNGYGPTENTTFSTTFHINREFTNSVPIGYPINNSTAYVVDTHLRLQPVGARGIVGRR